MSSQYKETWAEIRAGLGMFFKVCAYSAIGLIILAGIGFIAYNIWCK